MTAHDAEQMQRVADECARADILLGEGRALEAQARVQTALAILELTFGFEGENANCGEVTP